MSNGLVFEDLRQPNVMVVERRTAIEDQGTIRGMLVDSGKVGEATILYLPKMDASIRWADGVKAGGFDRDSKTADQSPWMNVGYTLSHHTESNK
jgi:hypothetical protein